MKQSYIISASLGTGCYRHIRIAADNTLDELHAIILDAFDFYDDHLHAFFLNNQAWSRMDAYYDIRMNEEEDACFSCDYKLNQLLAAGQKFKFIFDFGDEWTFQCKVLRIEQEETKTPVIIRCIGESPEQYPDYEDEDEDEDELFDFDDYDDDYDFDEDDDEQIVTAPTLEYNDRLYDLAFAYKQTKLWKKLTDSEIFAVQLPDGKIGYCCIMGGLGDYIALALYIGDRGWTSYLQCTVDRDVDRHELIGEIMMSQDCIHCVFENKSELSEEELESVEKYTKAHDIKLRGKNAFPHFIRYTPHNMPWAIAEEKDADAMEAALKAAIEVADQLNSGKSKLQMGIVSHAENVPLLIPKQDGFAWKITKLPEPVEESYPTPEPIDSELVKQIAQMKKNGGKWECQLHYMPTPVQEEAGKAPYFPMMLLVLDVKMEEMIPMEPKPNYEEYAQEILTEFAQEILEDKNCPKSIVVCDKRTELFLQEFCQSCGILMMKTKKFSMLDEFRENFTNQLMGGAGEDEIGSMLDAISCALLSLSDEEIMQTPLQVLGHISALLGKGILPPELEERLKKLLKK